MAKKIPSKKTTEVQEEPKKIKTTGKVAVQKTATKPVTKSSTPKKKGEKVPTVVKEVKSGTKTTKKTTTEVKKDPVVKKPRAKAPKPKVVIENDPTSPVTEPVPIMERIGPTKTKRFKEDRYVKISADESTEKFSDVGRRVQSGELQWAFYTVNNDIGTHYYLDLSKL